MEWPSFLQKKTGIGRGITILSDRIRVALTEPSGGRLKVLQLIELPLAGSELGFVKRALETLPFSLEGDWAVGVSDESLKIKRVSLPLMSAEDVPAALRWQVMGGAAAAHGPEMAIRYLRLKEPGLEPGKLHFLVFGLSKDYVERMRRFFQELGLKVAAAEPTALSVAAFQERFLEDPEDEKVRVLLHRHGSQGELIGMKGRRFLHWESFGTAPSGEGVSSSASDEVIQFQQCLEDFLMHQHLPQVEEAVLAGDWDRAGEEVSQVLGVPCRRLGEGAETAFVLGETPPDGIFRFAAELGLATYPRSDL